MKGSNHDIDAEVRTRARRPPAASLGAACAMGLALGAVACGDGTTPPPPPPPPPAVELSLDAGEAVSLSDPDEVRAFQLNGAEDEREYQVVVQSASQVREATSSLRLTVRGAEAGGEVSVATIRLPAADLLRGGRTRDQMLRLAERAVLGETVLKGRIRAEMARRQVTYLRPEARRPHLTASAATGPPGVGETLEIKFGIAPDGTVDCNSTRTIDAVVKLVGQHFVLAEDVQVTDGFSDQEYAELSEVLDAVVAPIDEAYFGEPADLDMNERVIVLFTAEVNRLSDEDSGGIILGFFFSGDILDPASCPAGNQGEILYLVAPDTDGIFGPEFPRDMVRRFSKGSVAHEYQHLINAERRFVLSDGAEVEDAFLNEALSHVAEEVSALALAGYATRANLGFDEQVETDAALEAFNAFHLFNFSRISNYFQNPNGTLALGCDPPCAPRAAGDPVDLAESLKMRGFGLTFLRWLADRYAPASPEGPVPGSGEHLLFRALASGGAAHLVGTENVVEALRSVAGVNKTWEELVSEYLAVPATDDHGEVVLEPGTQLLTWNLPDMYQGLFDSNLGGEPPFHLPYPLSVQNVTVAASSDREFTFEVNASTGRYFALELSAPAPDAVLEVTTQSGADVPASVRAQVTVVRTR